MGFETVAIARGCDKEPPSPLNSGRTTISTARALTLGPNSRIRAMIETLPLARAQDGYDRIMSGKARFRVVLAV